MTTFNKLSEEVERRVARDRTQLLDAGQKILSVIGTLTKIGTGAYFGGVPGAVKVAFPALATIIDKYEKGNNETAFFEAIKKLLPGNMGEEAMKILMANKDQIFADTASSLVPQILDIAKRYMERNSNTSEGKIAAALIGGLQTSISSLFAGVPDEQRNKLLNVFLENIGKIGDLTKATLEQNPDAQDRARRGREIISTFLHRLFSQTLKSPDKNTALAQFIDELSQELGGVLSYDPAPPAPAAAAAAAVAPVDDNGGEGRGEIKYGGSYPFWVDGPSDLSGSGIEEILLNAQPGTFNMSSFPSYSDTGFSNPEADIFLNLTGATNATNMADILNSSATAATTGSTAPQEQTWGDWAWSGVKAFGNGVLSLGGTVVRSLLPLVPVAAQFGLQALHNKTMARDNNNKLGRFLLNVDEFFSDPTKAALFNQALGQTVNYIGNQWDMKRNRDAVMKAYQDEINRADLANKERNRIYEGELAHARSERDDANRTIGAENDKLKEEYNQAVRKRRQQVGQNVQANERTRKENEIKQANYEKQVEEADKKYQAERKKYVEGRLNDLLLQRGKILDIDRTIFQDRWTRRQSLKDLREGLEQNFPGLKVEGESHSDFLERLNNPKAIAKVREELGKAYDATHSRATVELPTYGTMLPTDDPKNYLAMPTKPIEKPQVLTTRYVKPPETILPPRFPTETLLALNRQTPQNYVPPLLMQAPTKTTSSTTTSKYPYDADTLEEAIERLPYVKSPLKDPPTFVNPGPVGTSTPLNTVRVPSQSQKETIQTRPLSTSSYRNVFAQEEPHPLKMQDGTTTYGFEPKKRASVNSFQSSLTFNMPYDTVPQDPSANELYPSAKRRRTSSGKKGSSKK
jgi:hypothetical protein